MISRKGGNDLLAALPPHEREHVLKYCEPVTLRRDQILATPGERTRHVHFPVDSFISLLTGLEPHDSLAVALVGREGMLGTSLVMGVEASSLYARVQGDGEALRVAASDFPSAMSGARTLERWLRRYADVLTAQFARTASCAVFHVVELRLACWLLMVHDRVAGDRLNLTHDHLAAMLGIRRSGVTLAAGVLQRAGLIAYTRGHIAILDRKGLERATCGCYRASHKAFQGVVPPAPSRDHTGASVVAHGHAEPALLAF